MLTFRAVGECHILLTGSEIKGPVDEGQRELLAQASKHENVPQPLHPPTFTGKERRGSFCAALQVKSALNVSSEIRTSASQGSTMGPAPLPVFHSSDQASNFHPDWSGQPVSIDNWALIAMRNDEDREFILILRDSSFPPSTKGWQETTGPMAEETLRKTMAELHIPNEKIDAEIGEARKQGCSASFSFL